ncbi:MAG: hypothetical protein SFY80_16565 [Verrucomicrobiota bacterium]|nr:hypothetical protein [Verrucomicrobiota bacterium]
MYYLFTLFVSILMVTGCASQQPLTNPSTVAQSPLPIESEPSTSAIRKFDKETIERLGAAIYEQDIRAATATDLLLIRKLDLVSEGLKGWVVEGDKKSMLIRFVRSKDDKLEAFYDVKFEEDKLPYIEIPQDRTLTETQQAQYNARNLALQHITRPASRRYNTVVLPDPEGDGFLVYALAATTDPNKVMVGGHYRFTVSKDGQRLEQSDELFKSFLELDKSSIGLGVDMKTAMMMVSTLISDMPLETHVYLSLLHEIPLGVITPGNRVWQIQEGKISVLIDDVSK